MFYSVNKYFSVNIYIVLLFIMQPYTIADLRSAISQFLHIMKSLAFRTHGHSFWWYLLHNLREGFRPVKMNPALTNTTKELIEHKPLNFANVPGFFFSAGNDF